jgi:enoyl-CoA hydratase/carnithine racemase
MSAHVAITRDADILSITLQRADKKNALTGAMYEAIIAAFDDADADPRIGAILFGGSGGVFTAGNDIGDFLTYVASGDDDFPALSFIRRLALLETPIVASVSGLAVGVGVTMLLHCDLVYAAETATFRMPFVDLGLTPEAGASLLLPKLVGMQKASELLLLGKGFDAQEALRLGLVSEVLPVDETATFALARARELAAKPRQAVAATRRLLRGERDAILTRIDAEAALFKASLRTPDAIASLQAFMHKTPGRR